MKSRARGQDELLSRNLTSRKEVEQALVESQAALRESRTQLTAVTARLLRIEENELKRIAREIHDDLHQQLAIVSFELGQLADNVPLNRDETSRQLKQLEAQLARFSDDLHRMAYQLHPSILEELGLIPALRSHCKDVSKREGIEISFEHERIWKTLPNEVALSVYRVAQEALRNIVRHSNTKKADVSLSRSPAGVRLRIRDYGNRFSKERKKRGLGIISMEERVRLVGGTFSTWSESGNGMIIEADFPARL